MAADRRLAILSVHDKCGVVDIAKALVKFSNIDIVASDGTYAHLIQHGMAAKKISSFTNSEELLGGRVKSLHPKIFAGILARACENDINELCRKEWPRVKYIVCNLYPFEKAVSTSSVDDSFAIENIDIGGVALLRAGAKNHQSVTVVTDVRDYSTVIKELEYSRDGDTTLKTRQMLAVKAFQWTSHYDSLISHYMRSAYLGSSSELILRYGINPHQNMARAFPSCPLSVRLPFSISNGFPSYINILDALNAWQLVLELKKALNLPAAASFKHVSPAGVAVAIKSLTELESKVYMVDDVKSPLSMMATAYAKARGCDRLSSYGDFIALSDCCDVETARLIARDVSDGIIAPRFHPEALEMLKKKKRGNYCVIQIDEDYEPITLELRTVFGIRLEQNRNALRLNRESLLENIVANTCHLNDDAIRDLILASIVCKYTQSNAVCLAKDGQTVGIGAGQQSRIGCVRLACEKAENWWLRFHPKLSALHYADGIKRADKTNAIDAFLRASQDDLEEFKEMQSLLQSWPEVLSRAEKKDWIKGLDGVSLSSDAFFPFPDCIHRASQTGVKSIIVPRGSVSDERILGACEEHDLLLAFTDIRMFHH